MKYDFNIPAIELDQKPSDRTIAKVLAEFIGSECKGNAIKLYGWLKNLQANKPLELDEADKITLVAIIESTDRLYIFLKGQILEILNKK